MTKRPTISILIFINILILVSCNNKNDQVTFTGQIINPTTDMVWITVKDSIISTKLDENNKFTFELELIEANKYRFEHGGWTYVFLNPGSNLHITIDTKDFDNSITYRGTTIEENEYLKKRILLKESLEDNRFEIPNMNKDEFDNALNSTLGVWEKTLLKLSSIESSEYTKFKKAELEEES